MCADGQTQAHSGQEAIESGRNRWYIHSRHKRNLDDGNKDPVSRVNQEGARTKRSTKKPQYPATIVNTSKRTTAKKANSINTTK